MELRQCRTCGVPQEEKEFYIKDRKTGRRATQCRDCEIRIKGAKEVGKTREAIKLFESGFRKCGNCKTIKAIAEFPINQTHYGGIDNSCNICKPKEWKELKRKQKCAVGKKFK